MQWSLKHVGWTATRVSNAAPSVGVGKRSGVLPPSCVQLHGTANVLQVTVALWHVDETRVELVTSCAWAIKVTAHYKTIRMSHTTKSAKIKKKVILLCNTSPECQCSAV